MLHYNEWHKSYSTIMTASYLSVKLGSLDALYFALSEDSEY